MTFLFLLLRIMRSCSLALELLSWHIHLDLIWWVVSAVIVATLISSRSDVTCVLSRTIYYMQMGLLVIFVKSRVTSTVWALSRINLITHLLFFVVLNPLKQLISLTILQIESVRFLNESFLHNVIFNVKKSQLFLLVCIKPLELLMSYGC